jgi:GNAT superfamily N-acetyltransferase
VGRIAAFIDYTYKEDGSEKIGWFGLFESEEDIDTARLLIDSAIEYLKLNGCRKIIGPAKFNAGGEIGLLVDGFENEPYFMEPYNAPYYQDFFKEYGFRKENDWYSVNIDKIISKDYMEKVDRILERIINHRKGKAFSDYKIRNVDFSNLRSEIETIRELYNPIWNEGNHPQQVKMTDAEFDVLALGLKEISLEELIFIVEKDGKPVGISVNIPDINEVISEMDGHATYMPSTRFYSPRDIIRDLKIFINIKKRLKQKKFSRMRFFILGVVENHRKTGIDSKLYWSIKEKALELGITRGSASQLADINMDIINPIFRLGKTAMTWRVYVLDI